MQWILHSFVHEGDLYSILWSRKECGHFEVAERGMASGSIHEETHDNKIDIGKEQPAMPSILPHVEGSCVGAPYRL